MQQDIPQTLTKSTLIKYTILSLFFAMFALFTIILPAEYNIDPTGIGHKLGLSVFNQQPTEVHTVNMTEKTPHVSQTIEVIIPAGKGVEYKFIMEQYKKLDYEWITDGSALYFDLHGEPKGDTTGYYESYAIATLSQMTGSFTTPFGGSHGWYWQNKTDKDVQVKLTVKGDFISHSLK